MGGVKDIPGYRMISRLPGNAATLVYRALKKTDSHSVILKLPRSEYPSTETTLVFEREFRILRRISHEGVIRTLGLERYGNRPVLVLEDFGGVSLKSTIDKDPMPVQVFLRVALQIARALAHIHEKGVIHRDINPANMVCAPESERVKLIDFGVAHSPFPEETLPPIPISTGTFAYLSPEQTGRMDCIVDFRTDLYAAGVSFYEMLTGTLPFDAKNPMELVHSHIARQAVPPHKRRPEIPDFLSLIVMKLMEKAVTDRYQSAGGLCADLAECEQLLRESGGRNAFLPGKKEVPDLVRIPKKQYGRQDAMHRLTASFTGICSSGLLVGHGWSEMVFVSGDSGMGKTTLVRYFREKEVRNRGYFITGAFDRFRTNVPYTGFVEAFTQLVRQLLMESETRLDKWRDRLTTILGAGGSVLVEMIPMLESIIGEQPPIEDLRPDEVQNRLHLAFLNFIRAFHDPTEPLIIFLDDLQWADPASLNLIRLMATADDARFLFIGAFLREKTDVLMPLIKEIRTAHVRVCEIHLDSLAVGDIESLLADALGCEKEEILSPAVQIHQKTGGNPFFIQAFLEKMSENKGFFFDAHSGRWRWDETIIEAGGITDNAVRLMTDKICELPGRILGWLQLAACIGIRFELNQLAKIIQIPLAHLLEGMNACVTDGLLIDCRSGNGKAFPSETPAEDAEKRYQFLFSHEQIREAAYKLLPDEKKWEAHRKIAKVLQEESLPEKTESRLFDIVNQLNAGMPDPVWIPEKGRLEAAAYNNLAGKKAKSAAAFEEAFRYLKKGVALLPAGSWKNEYNLSLSLSEELAEASYLCGDFDRMEEMYALVCEKARSVLDMVKVHEVRLQSFSMRNRFQEAVETGLHFSKMLGFPLPENPRKRHVYLAFFRTWLLFRGKKIEDFARFPEMSDPHVIAAMRILSATASSAFLGTPMVYPLTILRRVDLCVRYGNEAYSAYTYAAFGIILCGVVNDIDTGYRFGKLALALLERFNARFLTAKVYLVVNIFVRHWKEHLRDTLPQLKEGYRSGLETGDLEFGYFCIQGYCMHCLFAGKRLPILEREAAQFLEEVDRVKLKTTFYYGRIHYQVILNLMGAKGASQNSWTLSGSHYDENKMMPFHRDTNDRLAIFWVYLNRLWLACLFHEDQKALKYADLAGNYLDGAKSLFVVPIYYFYDAMARLRILGSASLMERRRHNGKIARDLGKLKKWSRHAPMNHLHRYYLVLAEYYRVKSSPKKALIYYEKAIEEARKQAYIHEEALAGELAARFCRQTDMEGICGPKGNSIARAYLRDARYAYHRWGAEAKLRHLDHCFDLSPETTFSAYDTDGEGSIGATLAISSVMAAAQAISGEIVPELLLNRLLKIVMENAGAQKGYLILKDDASIRIHAGDSETSETSEYRFFSVNSGEDLPLSMVQYVTRTHESVVIGDAGSEGMFTRDPYVMEQKPKSVLCIPILRQGNFMGVLYLENSRIAGAFTPERMKVLKMLVSQAAISIDNARLYDKYHSLFENALEGLFLCSTEGRFQDVNPSFIRLLGYENREDMFSTVSELERLIVCPEDHEGIRGILRENGTCVSREIQMFQKDTNRIWVSFSGRVLLDLQNRPTAYEGSIVDISERKMLETHQKKHQEQLEGLVRERTSELTAANLKLNESIRVEQFRAWGMSLLNIMNDLLNECRSEAETYTVVMETCQQLFDTDSGCLRITNEMDELKTVFSWGEFSEGDLGLPQKACPIFQKERYHLQSFKESMDGEEDFFPFCIPLKGQAENLGIFSIHFQSSESDDTAPEERRRIIQSKRNMAVRLVEQYALLLANLRLRETLKIESTHDPLTGLYNRRHMEKSLEREVSRCRRKKTHLGIILLDIDHFKTFNDTYGHALGDRVLKELGRYLKNNARTEDIACRYGGEEFLLIMPESSLMSTAGRALDIRDGISSIRVTCGEERLGCTISAGVAGFPNHGTKIETVLECADQALYRAKKEGRDRVVIA